MALEVATMTTPELQACIDKAYAIASIHHRYNNYVNGCVSDTYNDALNMMNNGQFFKLFAKYPVIYDHIRKNRKLYLKSIMYRINNFLWHLTQHTMLGITIIMSWCIFICVAPPDNNFFLSMIYMLVLMCGVVLVFHKPKYSDNIRYAMRNANQRMFYNALNRNLHTLSDGALLHVQSTNEFKNAMDNQANELVQDVSALACYDAIPDDSQFYEMIARMKSLSDQHIAIGSWSELAGRARQELHIETQTQRVIDKLDSMLDAVLSRLDGIYNNQLTLIRQNNEIKGILHNIENATLTQVKQLNQLNRQVGDVKHIASNISHKMQTSFSTAIGVYMGDAMYEATR